MFSNTVGVLIHFSWQNRSSNNRHTWLLSFLFLPKWEKISFNNSVSFWTEYRTDSRAWYENRSSDWLGDQYFQAAPLPLKLLKLTINRSVLQQALSDHSLSIARLLLRWGACRWHVDSSGWTYIFYI